MNNSFSSQNIQNIIFDFGGVIIDIDFELTNVAFRNLGINDFEKLYSLAVQSHLFERLEIGAVTEQDFYSEFRSLTGLALSNEQIEDAWNKLLLNIPMQRVNLLEKCCKHYRTFLLSNTNEIHYRYYTKVFSGKYQKRLEDLFAKSYFSHQCGYRKPQPEIFKMVLQENNLIAENTLFIDDHLPNVEAARNLGMKGLHLNLEKGDALQDYFTSDGLLRL